MLAPSANRRISTLSLLLVKARMNAPKNGTNVGMVMSGRLFATDEHPQIISNASTARPSQSLVSNSARVTFCSRDGNSAAGIHALCNLHQSQGSPRTRRRTDPPTAIPITRYDTSCTAAVPNPEIQPITRVRKPRVERDHRMLINFVDVMLCFSSEDPAASPSRIELPVIHQFTPINHQPNPCR